MIRTVLLSLVVSTYAYAQELELAQKIDASVTSAQIALESAKRDLAELEALLATPNPTPTEFQPVAQFLDQVNNFTAMRSLSDAGWKWGWSAYTGQVADAGQWLAAVELSNRTCRLQVTQNWFHPTTSELTPMGVRGVANIRQYEDVVNGLSIEGAANREACFATLDAALGDTAYLLAGYMHHGKSRDSYARIWYPFADHDDPMIGKLKVRPHDPFGTWPIHVVEVRNPQRTEDNRPAAGVSTAYLYCQVGGRAHGWPAFIYSKKAGGLLNFQSSDNKDQIWSTADGGSGQNNQTLTGFIRPGRSHLHYQLLVAHTLNANGVTWYTNTSSVAPGNLNDHSPKLFADLIHVIEKYESQKTVNTYDREYVKRNPFVAIAPGNDQFVPIGGENE